MKPLTENEKMLLRDPKSNVVHLLKEFSAERPKDDRTIVFLLIRTYQDGLKDGRWGR